MFQHPNKRGLLWDRKTTTVTTWTSQFSALATLMKVRSGSLSSTFAILQELIGFFELHSSRRAEKNGCLHFFLLINERNFWVLALCGTVDWRGCHEAFHWLKYLGAIVSVFRWLCLDDYNQTSIFSPQCPKIRRNGFELKTLQPLPGCGQWGGDGGVGDHPETGPAEQHRGRRPKERRRQPRQSVWGGRGLDWTHTHIYL